MAEDHDLVRFLLGELDDAELERFHDLLENDPDKQQKLRDLETALTALGELRTEARTTSRPWLLRAAAILLAFLAGAAASHWMPGPEASVPGNSAREIYDRYATQPPDRSSLSRAFVALGGLRDRR